MDFGSTGFRKPLPALDHHHKYGPDAYPSRRSGLLREGGLWVETCLDFAYSLDLGQSHQFLRYRIRVAAIHSRMAPPAIATMGEDRAQLPRSGGRSSKAFGRSARPSPAPGAFSGGRSASASPAR